MSDILQAFLLPLIASLCCLIPSTMVAYAACFIGSIVFAFVLFVFFWRGAEGQFSYAFMHDIPIVLELDFFGIFFAAMIAVLFICASWYAVWYLHISKAHHQRRFLFFYTLSIWAAVGIAFAGNLMTMFIFYEMLTIFTYPLIVHSETSEARKAGRIYLVNLVGASLVFLLPVIAMIYSENAGLDFEAISGSGLSLWGKVLLLIAATYGVAKAALFPMHMWLPEAMIAPAPVSGLLHAVAVVKGGIFVLIKLYFYVFSGIDFEGLNVIIAYIAIFGAIFASFRAMSSDMLKTRLAFSTIAQLSYMIVSISLFTSDGVKAALLHMVTHSFAKISLFFIAGLLYLQNKVEKVSQMIGIARKMPVTMFLFSIASAAIIGLPLTAVFWSKMAIITALGKVHGLTLIILMIFATVLNVAYFFPIIYKAYSGATDSSDYVDPPFYVLLPVFLAVLVTVFSFFIPMFFPGLIEMFSYQVDALYD